MIVKNLGGHSGCQILLMEEHGKSFVRKISSSLSYNKRLEEQSRKQSVYHNPEIHVPSVLNSGYTDDNLFFFDMEYVRGISLSEYIQAIDVSKIDILVDIIINNIVDIKESHADNVAEIFSNKFSDLKTKLREIPWANNGLLALDMLDSHDWSSFSHSICHGDLTLENIMIKGDDIYLIDFLDSFHDSWLLDLGKLMQDIECMWSYRYHETDVNTIIRLRIFRDLLISKVQAINPQILIEIYYALLLHLVRIYPYAKDNITFDFLANQTSRVMNTIHKLEGN